MPLPLLRDGGIETGTTGETDAGTGTAAVAVAVVSTCQVSADRLPLPRTKRRPSTIRPAWR